MPITEDPGPRPGGDEPDPFADLVLDEEFIKAASVKEPSGRARMLAARWRKEPPAPAEAWRPPTAEIRRSRFGRRAKRVDPWGGRRRTRRNWQTPVFVVAAVAVVMAGLNVNALHSWYQNNFGGSQDNGAAAAKPVATQAPETAAPTAAPPTQDPDTPTVARPWAGSPAAAWPTGADGIALPQAQAVGAFDADQVGQDLALVKKYLVAANLDPSVVDGGATQPVLDLLDGKEQASLKAALAHPDKDHDPTSWISRFDPRTAVRAAQDIKVQGHVGFEGDGDNGLLVHTDYIYVYALAPGPEAYHPSAQPSGGSTGNGQSVSLVQLDPSKPVTREIVRRTQDFRFYDPQRYRVDPNKIVLDKGDSDMGGNYCETGDGWLQPDFEEGQPQPNQSGPTVDPYDGSKPLKDDGVCGTDSRS
ncbi:hypothetical protein LN042_29855 [Kitasatospora sp. RB6PN24]|uniref:SCO2583/SCO2584 N-terminal domain-containing protein n=1 Tax=Kitasatospora humi TaxID=2893891 RepID=UPI001E5862D2|nr:hypothetical protein [Kitasatospora humi]MCC9311215.1 hypothetical protein [Kitasatospora humi]